MVYSVPAVGHFVFARVTRISRSRGAECVIFAIGQNPLGAELRGIVRTVDVTSPLMQLEFSDIRDCFQAGDIIRAKVISLGDARAFFLSTVADDCGVVKTPGNLKPASYRLVEGGGKVERRKVARPVWLLAPS